MVQTLASETLCTILTPNGILGYGYEASHFQHGLKHYKPDAIIVDAGSTDPGPSLLGSGATLCSRYSLLRDLEPMLEAAATKGVKVLIGSAGGAGINAQVDDVVAMCREIAEKRHFKLRVGCIYSDVDKRVILEKHTGGLIEPCGQGPPPLQKQDIEQSTNIVAQIGSEPFLELLKDESVNVIVSGRAYDPAPFAAFAMHHGSDAGPAWHMGKIMECGALCALPKGKTIIARIQKDNFILTPMNPIERCTPLSVCAHTMYEKTRPDLLAGPGGLLDLTQAKYHQLEDERSVQVSNAVFRPSPRYQVKLEGASPMGYRAIFIGGIRDPTLIAGIDDFLKLVHRQTTEVCAPELASSSEDYKLIFHVYGKNAVMGSLEPDTSVAHEIGVMGEVLAPTQDKATSIAGFARVCTLHSAYPGQVATAGNLALPLTPLESPIGLVYKFSLYHLMDVDGEQASLFPRRIQDFDFSGGKSATTNGHSAPAIQELSPAQLPKLVKKQGVPQTACKLSDIACIIRSKNSGPFQITLDVLFDDEEHFERVRKADIFNSNVLAKLYQLDSQDLICTNMYFKPALAWKGTIVRPWAQGSVGERDTFGTQQHAPLLHVDVPAA